jgi:hypothetical protein
MSAAHVERPDSGGEAVHAFVGERDRFVFIVERQYAKNRPGLLRERSSISPDAGQHGRSHEISA